MLKTALNASKISPIRLMSVALVLTFIMLWIVVCLTWQTNHDVREEMIANFEVINLVEEIDKAPSLSRIVTDIIQSDSAELQLRYDSEIHRISECMNEIIKKTTDSSLRAMTEQWLAVNNKLVDLELRALATARSGNRAEAIFLIDGDEYYNLQGEYDRLQALVYNLAERRYDSSREEIETRSFYVFAFVGVVFLTLLVAWILTIHTVNVYLRERQRLIDELKTLTERDALTGIYNRHGFMSIAWHLWKNTQRINQCVALFFIDLDKLKPINDEFGHEIGDKAIIAAAQILMKTFRPSDVVGRLGGDEFAVIAQLENPEEAKVLEEQLNHAIQFYNETSNQPFKVSMSFGINICKPARTNLNQALSKADELMYINKRERHALRHN